MASVKVAVRVRPFNQRELDMGAELIVAVDGKKTRILNHKVAQGKDGDLGRERFKDFTFDHSYWSFDEMDNNFASQEMLFADLGTEVVDSAYEGYNACVFAYGQTGSGKTFTMMGSPDCEGLIPRICQTLFTRMSGGKEKGVSYRTEVSYLEIYNERVKDLLQPSDHHALRVREHPRLGPYVQDLSYHLVTDYHHIQALMQRGNARRTTASTAMNNTSSRSHAIFTLTFAQAGLDTEMLPSETTSKVHLVDLAGSERADTSGATGQRLKEGAHINKSLVTLGSVISALAELSGIGPRKSGSVFIPYRDSVLTWLLKDSLGGNSKTIMIAAISPADCNYGETLSTLRYANRAKNIINKPTINEDPNVKLIRDLREEISKLKSLLDTEQSVETQVLERELHQMEAQEKSLTEEWTEKWRETQQILQEQRTLGLRKAGLGVVLDSDTPHLVGIDDDLLSTGVTLYHLRDGDTRIGTDEAREAQDILLNGNGVEAEHCRVVLTRGVATLIPAPHAQCWVNTVAVDRPTKLSQGCIILLGRTNMFRYNDPVEAAKMRKEGSRSHLNLSRLSLLSFSTPDLAACSTESLWSPHAPTVSEEQELDDQRTALTIDREIFQREQAEREAEWEREQQDKRESLEQAQKELERERHKLEKEYAAQCRRLAQDWRRLEKHQLDNLAVMCAREAELNRRREMLLEERSGEQQQIEYECSQVAELRAEVVSRMRQFASVVSQELQLLQKTSGTNGLVKPVTPFVKPLQVLAAEKLTCESNKTPISDTSSESFASLTHDPDSFKCLLHTHKRDVLDLEAEIRSRVATAMERRVNISRLETEIADIDCSLEAGCSELREMRETLATRSQLQLRQLAEKKQSMSLDLKRSISVCRPDSEDSSDLQESPAVTLDTLSSSLSTADTFHTATSPAPDPVNPGAAKTSASMATEAELVNSNGIISNGISSNGISSNRTSSNGISSNGIDCNGIDSNGIDSNGVESNGVRQASDDSEVSSTEDVHKRAAQSSSSFEKVSPLSEIQNGFRVRRPRSHGGKYCREASVSQLMRAMKRLCLRVTQQKMLVMQSLDNDCPKSELDAHIALLQDYQRQYVRLEVALDRHPLRPLTLDNVASSEDSDNMSTSADDGMSELIGDGRSRLNDDGFRDNTSSADGGLTSPAFSAVSSHDTSPAGPPLPPPPLLSVPGYMVRGTGRQTHYEYEVQVACSGGERWSLMRRYKRFRELHLTMRLRYGPPVDALPFPPRIFFSNNSESVSRRRRADLESYLRQLIDTCSRIASCPLHDCRAGGTTKMALLEFSAFFRKGVFETGKYGTS